MARLKRDDKVVVIAGDDKGKTGRVLRVDRQKQRVLVEGVNERKKARRRSADHPQGGIEDIACPIHLSNVMHEDVYNAKRAKNSSTAAAKPEAADAAVQS